MTNQTVYRVWLWIHCEYVGKQIQGSELAYNGYAETFTSRVNKSMKILLKNGCPNMNNDS